MTPKHNNGFVSAIDLTESSTPPKGVKVETVQAGSVLTDIFQDLAAGAGGGLVVLVLALALGFDWWWQVAAATWGLITGVLLFIGRSRHAVTLVAQRVRYELRLREQAAEFDDAYADVLEQLVQLQQHLADERAAHESTRQDRNMAYAEAAQLRAQIAPTYRPVQQLYEKVRRDAIELLRIYFETNDWLARDAAIERLQWQRQRWDDAFMLLQDAGCVLRRGKRSSVLVATLQQAVQMIDERVGLMGGDND